MTTAQGDGASVAGDRRPWHESLAEGLSLQIGLAERLDALSREQREAIEADDAERVAAILEERQPIVEALAELAERCEPLAARLASGWSGVPEQERERLSSHVARLTELVSAVGARDSEDRLAMERRRDALGEEMRGLDRGRGAIGAYLGGTPGDGRNGRQVHEASFQDREG